MSRSDRTGAAAVMCLCGVIATGILTSAILSGAKSAQLLATGIQTVGTVVEITVPPQRRGHRRLRRPRIEFIHNGKTVQFEEEAGVWDEAWDRSGEVPVIFDSARPENATLNSGWYLWYDCSARLLVTTVFGTIAFCNWRQLARDKIRHQETSQRRS